MHNILACPPRLYRVLVFGTLSSSPVTSRLNVVFDLVPTADAMHFNRIRLVERRPPM